MSLLNKQQTGGKPVVFFGENGICGIHLEIKLFVKQMSYIEKATQLLTCRKDLLPYKLIYHLISQNTPNGNKKS